MSKAWPLTALGDHLDSVSRPEKVEVGNTYRMLGAHWYAEGLYIKDTLDGAGIQAAKVYRVEAGDFVYNRLFAWKGSFAVANDDVHGCYVSNEFPCFHVKGETLHPTFLKYYMSRQTAWSEALGLSTGGTPTSRNRLKEERLLAMKIPLPPITEQRRLAAHIDALAATISDANGQRKIATDETELLSQRAMETIRLSLAASHPRQEIGNTTKVTAGGTPSRENPAYWGGNIPWIKTGELTDGDNDHAEEHITQDAVDNSSAKLFPVDTVLVALYGQGQTRGRTGRLLIPATTNQACAAIFPCEQLQPRYIQFWLRSLYREMREVNHGGAQPNWNGQMIKSIKIAVAPPEEQSRIVAYLNTLFAKTDALKKLQAATAAELHALLPSILNKAFKGEL